MYELIKNVRWQDGVEILILAGLLYYGYRYFRNTRGAAILTGLLAILILLTFLSELLQLEVIGFIMRNFFLFLSIGLVVIFQPEMRRALAELGSSSFFFIGKRRTDLIDKVCSVTELLSNKRFGALIAIEADEELNSYLDTGVALDADFSNELLLTIFHPKTALHDGGMILAKERVKAAACVFPVSQKELLDRSIGLRHRAGLGISEETDCIAVVVSEETGEVSICHRGAMEMDLDRAQLRDRLHELLHAEESEEETAKPKPKPKPKKKKSMKPKSKPGDETGEAS